MLDRETFKNRLQIITDFYDMLDRVSIASNRAIQLFEIDELDRLINGYTDLLKRDMGDWTGQMDFSSIDWWLEEYILYGNSDRFRPSVIIDDKEVIINTPDKLYKYLTEYPNVS